MESAAARPARTQGVLVGALLGLAVVGWAVTGERMAGLDAGPGTDPGALGFFLVAWVVMMAAMMFPSTWPMAAVFRRVSAARGERADTTAVFVAGYLAAWTAFGLAAWALFEAVRSADVGWLAWDRGGQAIAAGVLGLAAVYQLTPLKEACLRRCRSPFSLVIHGFAPGRWAAFALGARHGAWCIGCCWGLMAALFALGVMSVGWMVLVAAVVAAEKLLPWRRTASLAVAGLLAALAVGLAVAPADVPDSRFPAPPPRWTR